MNEMKERWLSHLDNQAFDQYVRDWNLGNEVPTIQLDPEEVECPHCLKNTGVDTTGMCLHCGMKVK